MKTKIIIILLSIICFLMTSCKVFTRVTGIITPAGKIKNNDNFVKIARIDLDSNICMFMDQEIFLQCCLLSYKLLLDSGYIDVHNDTLVITANNTESNLGKMYHCFSQRLNDREGLQIYDPVKKKYHNKIVYERFHYYYGPLAAGAGWQYRIKGTKIIFKRRFKWIS